MPVFNPKRFVHPEALRRIRPRALLDLLRPHRGFLDGRELRLATSARAADKLDLTKLATILATPGPDTPTDLVDALYYINAMATPEGMHLLLDVVNDGQLTFMDDAAEPGDVAVRACSARSTTSRARTGTRSSRCGRRAGRAWRARTRPRSGGCG